MAKVRIAKYYDIIIALLLCLGSGTGALFAYASVADNDASKNALVKAIPKEGASYIISDKGNCVGTLDLIITQDKSYSVLLNGTLRADFGVFSDDIKLESNSLFNPLGQLTHAEATLGSQTGKVELTLDEVNPIKATITAKSTGKDFAKHSDIPGPLLLKETRSSAFELQYPHVKKNEQAYLGAFLQPFIKDLKLSITQVAIGKAQCPADASGLKLFEIVSRIEGASKGITSLLGLPDWGNHD